MRRAPRAAAALLALAACAEMKELMAAPVDDVARRTTETVGKVADNAVTSARTGELSRTASFTMEQEFHLGKSVAASALSRLGGRALAPEHPAARYLRDVGTVVALAAAELRTEDDRPYPLRGYRFLLVDAPEVNAVGTPGGLVLVTTGALRAARGEDELAAIVAHEVAHVQRGHTMSPVEAARRQEHLSAALLEGTDEAVHAFLGRAVSATTDFVLDKGYGKRDELAADAFAAEVLVEAGYDRRALSGFLSRLRGPAAGGGFFARHPPAEERVAALAALDRTARPAAGARERLARFAARTEGLPGR